MRFARIILGLLLCLAAASCASAGGTGTPPTTAAAPTKESTPAPTATATVSPDTPTPTGPLGSISGKILPPYPDQNPIPASRIFARDVDSGWITGIEIPAGQVEYTLSGVPVGTFEVVGWFYPNGQAGSYTSSKLVLAETSSDQFKCTTSIQQITLKAGQMEWENIDIGCWGGDFFFVLTPMP
jgi:hypothetical protein